jgi:hypothetical protein
LASNKRLIARTKSHRTSRRAVAQKRNQAEQLLLAGPGRHVAEDEWAQDVGILRGVTGGGATYIDRIRRRRQRATSREVEQCAVDLRHIYGGLILLASDNSRADGPSRPGVAGRVQSRQLA